MASFRYRAIDPNGREVVATMTADSAQALIENLRARGYRVRQVVPARSVPSQPPTRASRSQSQVAASHREPTVWPRSNTPTTTTQPRTIRAGGASDKALFFFFSQLQSLLNAGITPAQALTTLASRLPQKRLQRAAEEIGAMAVEGRSISDGMERYPYLFAPHVVGAMRAGEAAGYLPAAAGDLAEFFQESAGFRRTWWVVRLVTWNSLLGLAYGLPIVPAFFRSFRATMDSTDPNAAVAVRGFVGEYWHIALTVATPIVVGFYVVFWLTRHALSQPAFRLLRHRTIAAVPFGLSARARSESLLFFVRNLQRAYQGGISPQRAWELATEAMPNRAIAEEIRRSGRAMMGGAGIDEAFGASRLFPPEYHSLMITAQQTGDIVPTLERIGRMYAAEYQAQNGRARAGIASIGCLGYLILSGIAAAALLWMWYGGAFALADHV